MKPGAVKDTRALLLGCLSALLAVIMFVPEAVDARHFGSIRGGRYYRDRYSDRERELRRMQQDQIEANEEARREPAREKRREELEKERKENIEAYLEAKEAQRSSSQAALYAPRGFFYRKPGSRTSSLPVGAVKIKVKDRDYHFFSGVFYLDAGGRYVVVTAPEGAVVDTLPDGHVTTRYGDSTYYYYFGTFFAARGGEFEVVHPVPGVVVGYLPDGYNELRETEDDLVTYEYGGIHFEPVFLDGILSYMVVSS